MTNIIQIEQYRRDHLAPEKIQAVDLTPPDELSVKFRSLKHCRVGMCQAWLEHGGEVCTGCGSNENERGGPDDAA